MDIRKRIHGKLLNLGVESIHAYQKANLEYLRTGDEAANDGMLQAVLLHHSVCQMAEFMGVSSYAEFEQEILRLSS